MIQLKKLLSSLFYYFISAIGISLTIKAGIGVSSFNSLNVALSNLTSVQVGTITTIVNLIFLAGCLMIDDHKKLSKYFLMLIATLSFGVVINFVYYSLFANLVLSNYLAKMLTFIIGIAVAGFGTGQVLRINLLTFPIESFCQLLASQTRRSFSYYRYLVDISCVSLSLAISLLYTLPIVVREGTVLSLLLLSGIIGYSKKVDFFNSDLSLWAWYENIKEK